MNAPARLCFVLSAIMNVLAVGPVSGQEDNTFMPKGGKTLLLEIAGPPGAAELREIVQSRRTETEWHDFLAERHKTLSERAASELAAYLAVNVPLPEDTLAQAKSRGDVASGLPEDGRELAWTGCQFCHSLFSGYLMQQRDVQGWRSVFLSPFHRGIKMTAQERETFARYSAINMPMKAADVPAELRY